MQRKPVSVRRTAPVRTGVEVVCRSGCRPPRAAAIPGAARACLRAAGKRSGTVTILFTSDREMRSLNRKFRSLDRTTDVLSFPGGEAEPGSTHLGDLAISLPAARRYARKVGWSIVDEVRFLVLHGLLHLLGFDHETDDGAMERLQSDLARRVLKLRIPAARRGAGGPDRRPSRAGKRR